MEDRLAVGLKKAEVAPRHAEIIGPERSGIQSSWWYA